MSFAIMRKDVDAVVQAMFPGDPEAFGFYAELSGFGTKYYIISTNGKELVLTYMGKLFMDPKDTERYDIDQIEVIKIKTKLVAWALDIKPAGGSKLKFAVNKRAMDFSDYQKNGMERLKLLSR